MLFPVKQLVVVVVGHCVAVVVVAVGIGVSAAGSLLKATQLIDRSGQASEHRLPHIRVKYLRALRRYKCICVCSSFSGFLFVVCHCCCCCCCWAPSGPPFDVTGQLRPRCVLIASTLKTLFAFTAAKLVRSFRFRFRSSGRRVFVAFRNCSKMS